MLREVREMASALKRTARAPLLQDYIGPVLLSEPAAVEFFRQLLLPEMLGHTSCDLTGLFRRQPRCKPPPSARIGRRLLPFGWTVRDDATVDAPGHYMWDFEGVAPAAVDVVQNGSCEIR